MKVGRRAALLTIMLLGTVLAAAVTFVATAGPATTRLRPLPPLTVEPGGSLIAGLMVPPEAELVGRPFPLTRSSTTALLNLTGSPLVPVADLLRQLRATGYAIYASSAIDSARADAPCRVEPDWLRCAVTARPSPALTIASDPALGGSPVAIDVELEVGPGTQVTGPSLRLTAYTDLASYQWEVLDTLAADLPDPSTVGPAPAPIALPAPGDSFQTGDPKGRDSFTVADGSQLAGLWTGLPYTGDWNECSDGAFRAVLAVTGDPERVRDAYASQVPGRGSDRDEERWSTTTIRVHRTQLRRPILFRAQTAFAAMTTVTDSSGDTFLLIDYCRE